MSKRQQYFDSVAIPVGFLIVIGIVIIAIGNLFLTSHIPGDKDRLSRPELWVGVGILLGIITLMAILSRMPEDAGFLGKEVAVGSVGMWDDALPPVDPRVKYGALGTVSDITEGYTLYAASGALAIVRGVLPGGVDYGRKFSGMLYAQGVKSASKEIWAPLEAVTSVYPEAKAAFLAISGDETEALGWTNPPEGMTRGAKKHVSASDKLK